MTVKLVGERISQEKAEATLHDIAFFFDGLVRGSFSVWEHVPMFVGKCLTALNVRVEDELMSEFKSICKNGDPNDQKTEEKIIEVKEKVVSGIEQIYEIKYTPIPLDA